MISLSAELQRNDLTFQVPEAFQCQNQGFQSTLGEPSPFKGVSPCPVTVANEGLSGFPTKDVVILVVTVAGRGDNPRYINL